MDDFIEFGSSGKIYNKQQIIKTLLTESIRPSSLLDFKMQPLAPNLVLVTYQLVQHEILEKPAIRSLRSSLWKFMEERWQILFHQGTIVHERDN